MLFEIVVVVLLLGLALIQQVSAMLAMVWKSYT